MQKRNLCKGGDNLKTASAVVVMEIILPKLRYLLPCFLERQILSGKKFSPKTNTNLKRCLKHISQLLRQLQMIMST